MIQISRCDMGVVRICRARAGGRKDGTSSVFLSLRKFLNCVAGWAIQPPLQTKLNIRQTKNANCVGLPWETGCQKF